MPADVGRPLSRPIATSIGSRGLTSGLPSTYSAPVSAQHGRAQWLTIDHTIDITAVTTARSIVMLPHAHKTPTAPSGENLYTGDDLSVAVGFTDTDTINFDGVAADGALSRDAAWGVYEFAADAGPYTIALRSFSTVAFTTGETSKDVALSGVVDVNKVVPVLCAQRMEADDNTPYWESASFRVEIVDATTLRIHRTTDTYDASATVAALEFTGDAWSVQRVDHVMVAAGGEETESISPVDWNHTIMFHSAVAPDEDTLGSLTEARPGLNGTVLFTNGGGDAGFIGNQCTAYIIEDLTKKTVVERFTLDPVNGASESVTWVNTFPAARSMFTVGGHVPGNTGGANSRVTAGYEHTGDQAGSVFRSAGATDPDVQVQAIRFPAAAT